MSDTKTNELLSKIQKILENIDNVELLCQVSLYTTIIKNNKNDGFVPITHQPLLPFLVGLSIPIKSKNNPTSPDDVDSVLELLTKYFEEFSKTIIDFNNITSFSDSKMPSYFAIEQNLVNQIDPFVPDFHIKELLNNVTSKLDSFFIEKIGIDVKSTIALGEQIIHWHEGKINQRLIKISNFMQNARLEIQNMSEEFKEQVLKNKTEKEYLDVYHSSLISSNCKELFVFDIDQFCKEVEINKDTFSTYLKYFSCKFGTNIKFDHPLDDNLIQSKPIIDLENGSYFAPVPHYLLFNLFTIFEGILYEEKMNQTPNWQKYKDAKSKYLENKIYENLTKIFPKSSIFQNLSYEYRNEPREIDVLVQYDNKVFIFEAKSGIFTDPAKRGAIKRLTANLKSLIEDAYVQANTAREYIMFTDQAVFSQKNNAQLKIDFKKDQIQFFLINVTLEPLLLFNTQPQILQNLGLFKKNDYPWSVDIFDLKIITKHIPSPTIFIHYLERRLDATKNNVFFGHTELSYFSWYLEHGNFYHFLLEQDKPIGMIALTASDNDFNESNPNAKLPKLKIEPELLKIINVLEYFKHHGYSNIASILLDLDHNTRVQFLEKMNEKIIQTENDGQKHDFMMIDTRNNLGLTFVAVDKIEKYSEWLKTYCLTRKYETKTTRWLGILWSQSTRIEDIGNTFLYIESEWVQDNEMDSLIEQIPDDKKFVNLK